MEEKGQFGIELKWFGVSAYEIRLGGVTVVTDPFITENPKNALGPKDVSACDFIAITHAHYDHITDLPYLAEKFKPRVLCGELTAPLLLQWSDMCPTSLYPMSANLELDFNTVRIKALFGRHTSRADRVSTHLERYKRLSIVAGDEGMSQLALYGILEYRNYLFTTPEGTKLLVWGNELTPDQCNILRELRPDIAIMQLTRNSPEETASLCMEMGTRVVIPSHYDYAKDHTDLAEELQRVLAVRAPEIRCVLPPYGEWVSL